MKNERQKLILEIINSEIIETQGQLISALEKRGVYATQATLSRDIRDLNLIKTTDREGWYRYSTAEESAANESMQKLLKILKESVKSFDTAMNLVVLKTLPGLANAACSALDSMFFEGLVGTIAGDDTVFMAFKDSSLAESFIDRIKELC